MLQIKCLKYDAPASTIRLTSQLPIERGQADAEQFRGLFLVAVGLGQRAIEVIHFLGP